MDQIIKTGRRVQAYHESDRHLNRKHETGRFTYRAVILIFSPDLNLTDILLLSRNLIARFACQLRRVRTSLVLLPAAFIVSGCVTNTPQPPESDPDSLSPHGQVVAPEIEVPEIQLDETLVFDYLLADIAARRGEPAKSLEAMVRLAERTRDLSMIVRAFRSALRLEQGDVAERLASMLEEAGSSGLQSTYALVQAYLLQKRRDEAISLIRDLLREEGADYERIFNNAAEVFVLQSEPAGYLEDMESLVREYPENPFGFFSLAYLASRVNNLEILEFAINRVLELDPVWQQAALVKFAFLANQAPITSVREFSVQYLLADSDAVEFRERYARFLASKNLMEPALEQFQLIVSEQPKNSEALLAAALVSLDLDKLNLAERMLRRHLKIAPEHEQTRMYLGQVAIRRNQYEKAIDWYQGVRDDELYFEAQLRIGDALKELEGGDNALDYLHMLIPASMEEEVRLFLAQEHILRGLERLEEARVLLDAAVQEHPDNSELLYARALLAADLDLLELHEKDIRRVLELDPDNAHAYNALGYTLADQTDRYEEAFQLISRALVLAPDDPFILDSMGWVQYRRGKIEQALEFLRRAHEIRQDAEIAAHLGEVLWTSGRLEEADEVWKKGLELDPENATLKRTLERLKAKPPN